MFAFSQIQARTSGQVTDMEAPIGRYLGAAAEQGWHDSIFDSIYRRRELYLEDQDPAGSYITAEDANSRFAVGDLKFDRPIKAGVAQILNHRKQAQMNRDFLLNNDNHGLAAGIAGMSTQMVSSMLNPLDLGLLFLPVVGEGAKLAEGASVLGRGAMVRQAIGRGLISPEAIMEMTPATPKLTASLINGAAFMALAESQHQAATKAELGNGGDPLQNIAMGVAFAGGLHMALSAAGRLLGRMHPDTHAAMVRKAMDDFAKGNDIDVSLEARLDPAMAMEEAFRRDQAHVDLHQQLYDQQYQGHDWEGHRFGEQNGIAEYVRQHYPEPQPPEVPGTPREEARDAYDSVSDEIRKRGARTRAQIQALFPEARLSNEQAAELRRAAWGESAVSPDTTKDAQWDLIQEAIENSKQYTDASGNRTPRRQVDNRRAIEAGRTMPEEEAKANTHDVANPAPAQVTKLEEQAEAAKAKVEEPVKKAKKKAKKAKKPAKMEPTKVEPPKAEPSKHKSVKQVNEPVFHGNPAGSIIGQLQPDKNGVVFVTTSESYAKEYRDNVSRSSQVLTGTEDGSVKELLHTGKILDTYNGDFPPEVIAAAEDTIGLEALESNDMSRIEDKAFFDKMRELGYDGVKALGVDKEGYGAPETAVLNLESLKEKVVKNEKVPIEHIDPDVAQEFAWDAWELAQETPTSGPDTLVSPAIKLKDGTIVKGDSHVDAMDNAGLNGDERRVERGYATKDGKFMNIMEVAREEMARNEAKIAKSEEEMKRVESENKPQPEAIKSAADCIVRKTI